MGATNAIVNKAMKDPEFRQRLLNDPKTAIGQELGIEFAEGVTINVLENTPSVINIVLPVAPAEQPMTDQELAQVAGGLTLATGPTPIFSPYTGTCTPLFQPLPGLSSPIAGATFGAYTGCCS